MGGMIGAMAAMMAPRIPPRSRRKMMRTGRRIVGKAADVVQEVRRITS